MQNATFKLKVAAYLNPVGVISSPTGTQPSGFRSYPAGTVIEVDPSTAGTLRNTPGLAEEIFKPSTLMDKAKAAISSLIPQARHKPQKASKSYRGK